MAILTIPTGPRPFKPTEVTGAAAFFMRLITVPKEGEVLTVKVRSSGGGTIPFRVYGEGEDDAAEAGSQDPYAAGEPFVYSRDLGQQKRPDPMFVPWSILIACDESDAVLHCTVSYHRNS